MDQKEQVELENSILIEDYKARRDEIILNLSSARQVVNLTLTAIGILIAGSIYIIQSHIFYLFLVATLFLYCLAWTQLRYIFLAKELDEYIKNNILPRIRQNLTELSDNKQEDRFKLIMSWELQEKRRKLHRSGLWPIAGANYGIPLLAAAVSFSAFIMLENSKAFSNIDIIDILLILLNMFTFFYSLYWGYWVETH